jgi:hypothetical protein
MAALWTGGRVPTLQGNVLPPASVLMQRDYSLVRQILGTKVVRMMTLAQVMGFGISDVDPSGLAARE